MNERKDKKDRLERTHRRQGRTKNQDMFNTSSGRNRKYFQKKRRKEEKKIKKKDKRRKIDIKTGPSSEGEHWKHLHHPFRPGGPLSAPLLDEPVVHVYQNRSSLDNI